MINTNIKQSLVRLIAKGNAVTKKEDATLNQMIGSLIEGRIDLSNDTVETYYLLEGITAHDKNGNQIVGDPSIKLEDVLITRNENGTFTITIYSNVPVKKIEVFDSRTGANLFERAYSQYDEKNKICIIDDFGYCEEFYLKIYSFLNVKKTISNLSTKDFTYTVSNDDESAYTFRRYSDNYYYSDENQIDNTYSKCTVHLKVNFDKVDIVINTFQSSEHSYDFGVIGDLNKKLSNSNEFDEEGVKFSGQNNNLSGTSVSDTVVFENVSRGEYFFDVKYIKDFTTSRGGDCFGFEIVEIISPMITNEEALAIIANDISTEEAIGIILGGTEYDKRTSV